MENSTFFKRLAAPALVFALFFSICTYKGTHGIAFIIAQFLLVAFLCAAQTILEKDFKKLSVIYDLLIVGFGFSTFFNKVEGLFGWNNLALWVTTIAALIYTFYDDKSWGLGKQLKVIEETVFSTIRECFTPFKDFLAYSKEKKDKKALQVAIALAVTVPLITILTLLLMSSDAIFGNLVGNVFENLSLWNAIALVVRIIILFVVAYSGLLSLQKGDAAMVNCKESPNLDSLMGVIITGSVALLYFAFSFVQIFGLFIGHLSLPEGYTYAQYAREGFFQLLAVCVINLLIVVISNWCFKGGKLLNSCLVVISAATYIMLASSAFKMSMYVSVYGLTRLRYSAYAGIIVVGILMAGITVSVFKKKFPLYRFCLFTVLFGYLLLSLSQMDYWIDLWNSARGIIY